MKQHYSLSLMVWTTAIAAATGATSLVVASELLPDFSSSIGMTLQPGESKLSTTRWSYDTRMELDIQWARDFDLDSREDDDTIVVDPKLEFSFAYRSEGPLSA